MLLHFAAARGSKGFISHKFVSEISLLLKVLLTYVSNRLVSCFNFICCPISIAPDRGVRTRTKTSPGVCSLVGHTAVENPWKKFFVWPPTLSEWTMSGLSSYSIVVFLRYEFELLLPASLLNKFRVLSSIMCNINKSRETFIIKSGYH